jgi:FtsH-binding integral membrane protein
MSDPITEEPAVKEEDQFNFNWWVTMLPFLAAVCWFIFRWSQNRSDGSQLLFAVGALVIGLVIGSIVSANSGTTGGAGSEDSKS